ncbi:hypothetical protein BABINDRAFT_163831 [Babjeviella inositovora NRRL Y-12698]|uniref:ADP-ribose 1''-phosphate phosphatase n=1 Tax=Babjeviella inositovora NRRL Y-12698 TaxID=984486 RepID=A0A1E3QHJ4_9ASCO|nr:uncharacterized protein BABINDRAFT_163831 [Babjeviella inositovora NRRL Y-12698]ODQ77100.1 hypothetical protein BABINDRAFT_163831 [Babjeviella inositovora NRRL Y-12698]
MPSVNYIQGDLFTKAPQRSILAHACNCQGAWNGGIAVTFKKQFPSTYAKYQAYCQKSDARKLLGTTLIIPSTPTDPGNHSPELQIVACLFTSSGTSANRSPEDVIVTATEKAMEDLYRQLAQNEELWDNLGVESIAELELHMPKINAGLFGVPWGKTEAILEAFPIQSNVYVIAE